MRGAKAQSQLQELGRRSSVALLPRRNGVASCRSNKVVTSAGSAEGCLTPRLYMYRSGTLGPFDRQVQPHEPRRSYRENGMLGMSHTLGIPGSLETQWLYPRLISNQSDVHVRWQKVCM